MKILLVEDDNSIREMITGFLERDGYTVRAVGNGLEGLALMKIGPPDAVITDIKMPEMDGLEFLKRSRENCDVPFIMITGYADLELAIESLNNGAAYFIHKPVNFIELKAALNGLREKKELERKLKQERAKLLHMSRLADLGQLMAGLAHEINNPITFIADNIPLLNSIFKRLEPCLSSVRSSVTAEQREAVDDFLEEAPLVLQTMARGCEQVSSIIQAMTSFSRRSRDGLTQVYDLNQCVRDALQIVPINAGVTVETSLAEGVEARGSKTEITQVITNLISNARDAVDKARNKIISIRTYANGGSIFLEVSDTGPGIPKRLRDRVFTPFFTTKEPGKGTGLGLSISYGIAAAAAGELTFNCPGGGGTTFKLRLPAAETLK